MFENLKSKNSKESNWSDRPNAGTFPSKGLHHSPGATSFQVKGNEATRMVRCRICGFPCDKERDGKAKYDTWAGFGINQGAQLTAGTSIGDARTPAAGNVGTHPDQYYARSVTTGCPACGCLVYWT